MTILDKNYIVLSSYPLNHFFMNDSLHTYKSIDKVSSPPENKKYLAIQKARREIDPHLNKENYNKGSIEHDETTDIQDEISDLLSLINERDFKNSHGYTSNILIKFALEFDQGNLLKKQFLLIFKLNLIERIGCGQSLH